MASLRDIKVNINVDTTDFIKSLRQLQESIKMDDVRILKGWTKEEQKELEEAKDNGFLSAMSLICGIDRDDGDCHTLSEKYCREDTNDDNQMAKDIIDFYCGNAKFSEQKYYIKLPKLKFSYLIQADGITDLDRYLNSGYKEEFTEQEIKDIDPRYMAFAVPVETDDE